VLASGLGVLACHASALPTELKPLAVPDRRNSGNADSIPVPGACVAPGRGVAARTPAKHLGAGPLDFTYEKRSSSPKQGDVEVPAGGARKDFVNSLQIGRTRGIPWLASTDLEGLAGVAVGRALLGHEEFARAYQHGRAVPPEQTTTDALRTLLNAR
jgi:hypothetical protein